MSRKIIAVVGGTGAQGSGLVHAIHEDPAGEFQARVLTRNPESEAGKRVAALGAEVVRADLDDEASIRKAFEGAYGAYCVTFFWDHFSPERELRDAELLAKSAAAAGLKHVIWSTLEDTRELVPLDDERMPTLMGKYKVPHFDAKGEANRFFIENNVPTTFLLTSFYWDNFIHFGLGPQADANGDLFISFPMGDEKLPGIAAEDIGRSAYGIFKAGPSLAGKTIGIAGEHLTGAEMAAELSRQLGSPVRYEAADPNAYRALGFPGADDLGNMFQFKHDFNQMYCASRSIERTRALSPKLQTLSQWLETHSGKLA
ncbi:MAG: NmrA/HSCARG family protein [Sphingomonas sp.]